MKRGGESEEKRKRKEGGFPTRWNHYFLFIEEESKEAKRSV